MNRKNTAAILMARCMTKHRGNFVVFLSQHTPYSIPELVRKEIQKVCRGAASTDVRVAIKRRSLYVRRNVETRWCSHLLQWKAISIACCEYLFVAFGIQRTMHACRFTLLSVWACPARQYFSALSHKGQFPKKKKELLDVKCVFLFSLQIYLKRFSF